MVLQTWGRVFNYRSHRLRLGPLVPRLPRPIAFVRCWRCRQVVEPLSAFLSTPEDFYWPLVRRRRQRPQPHSYFCRLGVRWFDASRCWIQQWSLRYLWHWDGKIRHQARLWGSGERKIYEGGRGGQTGIYNGRLLQPGPKDNGSYTARRPHYSTRGVH